MEGDLYLSLRNPLEIPTTMFWHSNGGRDYAPWSGRHFGCLGVEEGAANHMLGLSTEKDFPGSGEVHLSQGRCVDVSHVIGAITWPSREPVAKIEYEAGELRLTGEGGSSRVIPFNGDFLGLPDATL